MANQNDFCEYVMSEVLVNLRETVCKGMFGGYGLYLDGVIFGIIAEDELYFKVDDANRGQYQEARSEPFVYTGHKNKRPTKMPYWKVPQEVLEDSQIAADWARQSATVSRRNKK